MGVDEFGAYKGYKLEPDCYNQQLVRRLVQYQYRREMAIDISATIFREVSKLLDKTELEHRFAYKLLPSGNLLIGIDPRDLIPLPKESDDVHQDYPDL